MDSRTAEFLSRLLLEDDEDDAMFSVRWSQEKPKDADEMQPDSFDPALEDKTVQLSDDVNFDQYSTFKLLMQILYGLRQMGSLTVDQATNIFYYAHKYEIKDVEDTIQKFLNERMKVGMSKKPLSVAELTEGIQFAQLYHLDEFKNKLDQVKLDFDEDNLNTIQFWDLSTKFEMKVLQQKIIDHMVYVAPKDWPVDLLLAVTGRLQTFVESTKKVLEKGKVRCVRAYTPYCQNCGALN